VFGFRRAARADQAATTERLAERLAEAREDLVTQTSLRQRHTFQVDDLQNEVQQLRQQRTNARNAAERTNRILRDHRCAHVPDGTRKLAEENARLRVLVADLTTQLLQLQDANVGAYRALAEERGAAWLPAKPAEGAPALEKAVPTAPAEGAA
jgi:hypothetical protein